MLAIIIPIPNVPVPLTAELPECPMTPAGEFISVSLTQRLVPQLLLRAVR